MGYRNEGTNKLADREQPGERSGAGTQTGRKSDNRISGPVPGRIKKASHNGTKPRGRRARGYTEGTGRGKRGG